MTAMTKKIRSYLWGVLYVVLGVAVIAAMFFGKSSGPHEGDKCGPHHHWVAANRSIDGSSDMSCEAD
jgi:hypothetical protein